MHLAIQSSPPLHKWGCVLIKSTTSGHSTKLLHTLWTLVHVLYISDHCMPRDLSTQLLVQTIHSECHHRPSAATITNQCSAGTTSKMLHLHSCIIKACFLGRLAGWAAILSMPLATIFECKHRDQKSKNMKAWKSTQHKTTITVLL